MALSYNGGKDCVVLLHLLQLMCPDGLAGLFAVYFNTDADAYPEAVEFMHRSARAYGLSLAVEVGAFKSSLARVLEAHPVDGIFMGTRRSDPYSTHLSEFHQTDAGWPDVCRIHPILDWEYADVWVFLRALGVPYCVLYDRGFTSLGAPAKTVPNPALRRPDGTFAPAYELQDGSLERDGRR